MYIYLESYIIAIANMAYLNLRRVDPLTTSVCCAGSPMTRYREAREPLPRVPTAFQGSKCVRGGLQGTRYQVRANALLDCLIRFYEQLHVVSPLKVPCSYE